jgi:hypothetical protein
LRALLASDMAWAVRPRLTSGLRAKLPCKPLLLSSLRGLWAGVTGFSHTSLRLRRSSRTNTCCWSRSSCAMPRPPRYVCFAVGPATCKSGRNHGQNGIPSLLAGCQAAGGNSAGCNRMAPIAAPIAGRSQQALPLFLDRLADPVTAVALSVTSVLVFGG